MNYYKNLANELQEFLDFQSAKEKVMLRVVSYEDNLTEIPHRKFLNLAVTYYYMLSTEREIIPINNNHVAKWKIRESDLYRAAMENTLRRLPAVLVSAEDYMFKALVESMEEDSIKTKKDFGILVMQLFGINLENKELDLIWKNESYNVGKIKDIIIARAVNKKNMYILSNRLRIYGAVALVFPKCLKDAADHIGSDLYIIPASIHELVILPVDNNTKLEELKSETLRASNEVIAPEDRLTSDIYIYERKNNTIKLV